MFIEIYKREYVYEPGSKSKVVAVGFTRLNYILNSDHISFIDSVAEDNYHAIFLAGTEVEDVGSRTYFIDQATYERITH